MDCQRGKLPSCHRQRIFSSQIPAENNQRTKALSAQPPAKASQQAEAIPYGGYGFLAGCTANLRPKPSQHFAPQYLLYFVVPSLPLSRENHLADSQTSPADGNFYYGADTASPLSHPQPFADAITLQKLYFLGGYGNIYPQLQLSANKLYP